MITVNVWYVNKWLTLKKGHIDNSATQYTFAYICKTITPQRESSKSLYNNNSVKLKPHLDLPDCQGQGQ